MIKYLVLITLLYAPVIQAQDISVGPSEAVLDSIYTVIKTRSLHREQVDWLAIDTQFNASVDSASSFGNALLAFRDVFRALDDVHSAIYYDGRGIGYNREPATASSRNISALISLSRQRAGQPVGKLLSDDIGYVFVPSYGTQGQEAIDQAARELRDVVCDLSPRAAGWIIDLRLNEGGNVYPMLSGLGDMLGDGLVARSVDAMGSPTMDWSIREGILFLDDYQTTTVDRRCTDAHGVGRVAVLLGPTTLSSAQLTAIAFAGWEQTRFFGESTGDGYATSNQWYQMTPSLGLNLSEAYFSDRNGFVYEGIVEPDEVIGGDWDFEALENDAVVRRAMEWIQME